MLYYRGMEDIEIIDDRNKSTLSDKIFAGLFLVLTLGGAIAIGSVLLGSSTGGVLGLILWVIFMFLYEKTWKEGRL